MPGLKFGPRPTSWQQHPGGLGAASVPPLLPRWLVHHSPGADLIAAHLIWPGAAAELQNAASRGDGAGNKPGTGGKNRTHAGSLYILPPRQAAKLSAALAVCSAVSSARARLLKLAAARQQLAAQRQQLEAQRPGGRRGRPPLLPQHAPPATTDQDGCEQEAAAAGVGSSGGDAAAAWTSQMDGNRPGGRRSGFQPQRHHSTSRRDGSWNAAAVAETLAPFRPGGRLRADQPSSSEGQEEWQQNAAAAAVDAAADERALEEGQGADTPDGEAKPKASVCTQIAFCCRLFLPARQRWQRATVHQRWALLHTPLTRGCPKSTRFWGKGSCAVRHSWSSACPAAAGRGLTQGLLACTPP